MAKANNTKKALLSSAFALLICVAMLIGTTFAWFTDTVSTAVNKIKSGTLKVDIVKEDGETSIKGESMSFVNVDESDDILWEPGVTFKTPAFKIKSTGSLALKYKLALNGVNGDSMLLDVIKFSVVKADGSEINLDTFEDHLKPGDELSQELYIKGHMDEAAGNDYQGKELTGLGITVYATQDTVENDIYGNEYDKNATYYPVIDAAGLKNALANGGNVTIANDVAIVPKNVDTTVRTLVPLNTVNKDTTIDLSGKKIGIDESAMGNDYGEASLLLMTVTNGTLTINGDGEINCETGSNQTYGINVKGGNLVINGGKYYGAMTAIQVQNGNLEINGGFFDMAPTCKALVPQYAKYIINCIDEAYKDGTAKISIKGGTFVNFNPSANPEGAGTTYVADGYSVIEESQANGDVWYTVVKGNGATAGTQDELNTAINGNSEVTVKLTKAGTYNLPGVGNKEISIIGTKDTVINVPNAIALHDTSLTFEGVKVKSSNANYTGLQHTKAITFKNCSIEGQTFLYAADAQFIGCTFTQTSKDAYNVWTYGAGNVLFKNCTFNCAGKSVLIYNEGSITGQTVEFQNCKFNASAPVAGKAAIEIDSSLLKNGVTYKVIIDKATADSVTGFGTGNKSGNSVWNNKLGVKATVIVDGKTVLSAE